MRMLQYGLAGETYLVGGSGECSNLELLRLLLTIVDEELGRTPESSWKLIKFVKDRPGHDFRYAIDASKLVTELGGPQTIRSKKDCVQPFDGTCPTSRGYSLLWTRVIART